MAANITVASFTGFPDRIPELTPSTRRAALGLARFSGMSKQRFCDIGTPLLKPVALRTPLLLETKSCFSCGGVISITSAGLAIVLASCSIVFIQTSRSVVPPKNLRPAHGLSAVPPLFRADARRRRTHDPETQHALELGP